MARVITTTRLHHGDSSNSEAQRDDTTEKSDAVLQDDPSLKRRNLGVDLSKAHLVGFSALENLPNRRFLPRDNGDFLCVGLVKVSEMYNRGITVSE